MTAASLDGPRIAEVFLAELDGRELGPLADVHVAGFDGSTLPTGDPGQHVDILAGTEEVATLEVVPDAAILVLADSDTRLRIDGGAAIKPALDELLRRTLA